MSDLPDLIDQEFLLRIFLEEAPSARSPYAIYGHPPMWLIARRGSESLLARPGRVMDRVNFQYVEVDGVHWQVQRNGIWTGQGYQAPIDSFLNHLRDWRDTPVAA